MVGVGWGRVGWGAIVNTTKPTTGSLPPLELHNSRVLLTLVLCSDLTAGAKMETRNWVLHHIVVLTKTGPDCQVVHCQIPSEERNVWESFLN